MVAKDNLSNLEITLVDHKMESIVFTNELDSLKATNKTMTSQIRELKEENSSLEEEANGLFGKVLAINILNVPQRQNFKKVNVNTFITVDDC